MSFESYFEDLRRKFDHTKVYDEEIQIDPSFIEHKYQLDEMLKLYKKVSLGEDFEKALAIRNIVGDKDYNYYRISNEWGYSYCVKFKSI